MPNWFTIQYPHISSLKINSKKGRSLVITEILVLMTSYQVRYTSTLCLFCTRTVWICEYSGWVCWELATLRVVLRHTGLGWYWVARNSQFVARCNKCKGKVHWWNLYPPTRCASSALVLVSHFIWYIVWALWCRRWWHRINDESLRPYVLLVTSKFWSNRFMITSHKHPDISHSRMTISLITNNKM